MSSDSSSSLVAAKDAELAELRAREASWKRIAVQSVALVRAQDEDERPAGMWLRVEDRELLDAIQGGQVALGAGGSWTFADIYENEEALPSVYDTFTHRMHTNPRPDITPFRSSFPIEILEHILSFAKPKAVAAFTQASFACLEHFGPRLLADVTITVSDPGLKPLFASRASAGSARLSAALSLHHMQTLDVGASALVEARTATKSRDCLDKGKSRVRLSLLTIRMDFASLEYPDSSDLDSMDGWSDEDEDEPAVVTFRPSVKVLGLFSPAKLVLIRKHQLESCMDDEQYRITRAAATAIDKWTRLRTIVLVNVDFYVFPANGTPDKRDVLDIRDDERHFFLGPSIVDPLEGKGSSEWTFKWDLSEADHVCNFGRYGGTFIGQLAKQGGPLTMSRIKAAVIRVKDNKIKKELEDEIKHVDPAKIGPLKVYAKAEASI